MKRYKHKRSSIIVEYHPNNYYQQTTNSNMRYAKVVVEGSSEWEEIKPLLDFCGRTLDNNLLHYKVILLNSGNTVVWNGLNREPVGTSKVITVFKEYEEACKYQRLYSALTKVKLLILDEANGLTSFALHALKNL